MKYFSINGLKRMFVNLLTKIFGSRNDRLLKKIGKEVKKINALEPVIEALSDEELKAKTIEFKTRYKEEQSLETKVEVLENGPLLVYGTLKVTDKDGKTETKNKTTAFCRCGQSNNKPYCDGSHIKAGFKG